MLTEKRLHQDIKKCRRQLAKINFYQLRNPISLHWWQKLEYRRLNPRYESLILDIIVDTVALDKRYRDGTWNTEELVPELIKKGLASG